MGATAIVVPVPEAEPVIGRWRRRYTDDGADGMPAHVTLLYPFTDAAALVAGRIREAREVMASFAPVAFTFRELGSFPGSPTILYLGPEPDAPFREMTEALVARFPEHRPYGGIHEDVIPHVTVAAADDERVLEEVRAEVGKGLPIACYAAEAALMQYADDGWRRLAPLPFAGKSAASA